MVDFAKCSSPTRVSQIENAINVLKELDVEEVYIEVVDPNNVCFTSTKDGKLYAFCYSKEIEDMAKRADAYNRG